MVKHSDQTEALSSRFGKAADSTTPVVILHIYQQCVMVFFDQLMLE